MQYGLVYDYSERFVHLYAWGQSLFTGKARDPIMGVDYFGARYYKNDMGRFYSPDDGEDQNPLNPQSWNLYTYVRNNPSTLTDEDGRSVTICDANGHCSTVSNDDYSQAQQQDKY